MTNPLPPGAGSAESLARSFQAFAQAKAWEVDVSEPASAAVGTSGAEAETSPPSLPHLVEALLFVGGAPLTAERAAAAIRGLTATQFTQAIAALNHTYRRQGRPYVILAQSQGYVLSLRPRFRAVEQRLYGQLRQARLSTQAIDVLALVAYRQPVTKQEIESIRGAESGALVRHIVRRNLIAVVHRSAAGQ